MGEAFLNNQAFHVSSAFRSAVGYLYVGELLCSDYDGIRVLFYLNSPCITNLSFACELFLKILYYTESDKPLRGKHDLYDYYSVLSRSLQREIQEEYEKHHTMLSFDECLNTHKNAFTDFRYSHEGKSISFERGSLLALAKSLKAICERAISR